MKKALFIIGFVVGLILSAFFGIEFFAHENFINFPFLLPRIPALILSIVFFYGAIFLVKKYGKCK